MVNFRKDHGNDSSDRLGTDFYLKKSTWIEIMFFVFSFIKHQLGPIPTIRGSATPVRRYVTKHGGCCAWSDRRH